MKPALSVPSMEILGAAVPLLGFGTWELRGRECEHGVAHALSLGYRHVDTAQMYENEAEVGRGLEASGVGREEVFLTSKLAPGNLARSRALRSTEASLRALGTGYLDLLLIHWPRFEVPLGETLEAMGALQEAGKIRWIGVSNFPPSHLSRARKIAEIFCNQVEYHPFLSQDRLLRDVRDEGLLLTAYCPLARGRVAEDKTISEIAAAHGKSPAQIALRWLIQQKVAAIPKASKDAHREENLDIFDFSLSDEEMERIFALGGEERIIDPSWAPEWERG